MRQQSSGSRRRLQWTLGVLAAIPVASAAGEILRGPQGVPGGSPDVIPTVDSALRYANVFKFAVGPVIWSQLGRVEQSPALSFAAATIAIGGLARLRSWQQRGRPHPITVGAIALETIGVPILLAWQRRLSAKDGMKQMPSVLVTGAGRGIGLAITERMSRRGWNVYATARSDAALNSLDRLPNVHAIALDITDRSAIAALPDQLPAELNGVVNNAGIIVNGPVEGLSLDDLTQQLDINVISQIAVTQAVLPKIRNARGRVVFMSSVSGLFTTPGTGAYNASKYAIESLADALRMELRPWRIPVSLIEPGPIRTDMWADALDDYDHMTKQLSDEHRRLYASHLAGSRKLLGRLQKLAADPKRVTKAVDHALTSRRPKRRYLLDIVSRAQKTVVAITPTAVNDAVLAAATTSK